MLLVNASQATKTDPLSYFTSHLRNKFYKLITTVSTRPSTLKSIRTQWKLLTERYDLIKTYLLQNEGQRVFDRLLTQGDKLDLSSMDNAPTFIPQINPISDELDNRMKITQGGKERWQTLYELGQKKREEMDQLRQNYAALKEQQEKSMTFRPQIHSKPDNNKGDFNTYRSESATIARVAERSKIWLENKLKKIEVLKDTMGDGEVTECTFQPKLFTKLNTTRHASIDSERDFS